MTTRRTAPRARSAGSRTPAAARAAAARRRAATRRRNARRARAKLLLRRLAVSAGVVAVVAGLFVLIPLGLARDPAPICIDRPSTFPEAGIEGWRGEQLENAATIIRTASTLGFGRDGQILGVMTAMGESSLRAIDYGDWETSGWTNPDGTRTTSIGLFQQQDWWGSVEQRMDPATSATLFFERLGRLPSWQTMPPSHAIHRVQINTDRDYYARYEDDATAVVDALSAPCE